jgi:hypothetical protein
MVLKRVYGKCCRWCVPLTLGLLMKLCSCVLGSAVEVFKK